MAEIFSLKATEKKVEYLELIYDLIFVYIIGRNNSLLHTLENGFIVGETYAAYILSTLVILQIWYSTTLYVNRYGRNGLKEHLAIFINMYLLYYMADGTRVHWQEFYFRYNIAWGLILVNLAVQYFIRLRQSKGMMPWEDTHIKYNMWLLLLQAAIVFVSLPLYVLTEIPFSPLAMVFGIIAVAVTGKMNKLMPVDFPHLTERVMLYVVFTFGEMIIGIAGYFEGGFGFNSVYFSLMAFLIVVGLFQSYGCLYDKLIDRHQSTTGAAYMLLHVFIITAMNNITTALEFMREPEVAAIPKNIFLAVSFLVYFIFLLLLNRFSRHKLRNNRRAFVIILLIFAAYLTLTGLFYAQPYVSIAVAVVFIYAMYGALLSFAKKAAPEA